MRAPLCSQRIVTATALGAACSRVLAYPSGGGADEESVQHLVLCILNQAGLDRSSIPDANVLPELQHSPQHPTLLAPNLRLLTDETRRVRCVSAVDVAIYEGERSHTGGNTQIGEFTITGTMPVANALAFCTLLCERFYCPTQRKPAPFALPVALCGNCLSVKTR